MKIVLAFDSFKGSLTATEACRIASEAIFEVCPDILIVPAPMADGGEGTAATFLYARPGEWISVPATGPLPSQCVDAGFAWFESTKTAVIEMASASGITILRPDQLNPLATTTRGTGELLLAAMGKGAERLFLGAGGSATVDGGTGAAHALGWRFLDASGKELAPVGGNLEAIHTIVKPATPPQLPRIHVLTDVETPLCDAARIFGPQKGATPAMVEKLSRGLDNLARRIHETLGMDVSTLSGGGAAGGLAAGAVAFFGATMVSGIETVMKETDFAASLSDADWILTGEGSFDEQSLDGKVVTGILRAAQNSSTRIAVIAGRVLLDPDRCARAGIIHLASLTAGGLPTEEAIRRAPGLLHDAVLRFAEERLFGLRQNGCNN